jgi:hypothetical protein
MTQQAITAVLNLYAVALDSHSWDLFDEIFAPDVDAEYAGGQLHWHDLASFKRDFRELHEGMKGHQHFLGVPQIIIEGDRAFALTYGRFNVFWKNPAPEPADMSEGGAWYDDELERGAAGWRISKRVAQNFWSRGGAHAGGTAPHAIDSFPDFVRAGRVGYLNALRRHLGHAGQS